MDLESHRVELTGYCYRMLGGPFEAEDAVQETFVRAWRGTYDPARGSLRAWLYAIATNVCLDLLRTARRRAVAMDLASPAAPGTPLGEPLPASAWVLPVPDERVLPADQVAADREGVRLAFVAALQHLPPRQRAVLILRDVLCWRAAEVARLLGTTVASVNSALQRARATIADRRPEPLRPVDPGLLERYATAFERHDVPALVALLHEDATTAMPPFAWWLRGRADIAAVLSFGGSGCETARLVPARASGVPAFGQYRPDGEGAYRPFALVVVEFSGGCQLGATTFLGDELFGLFGLPMSLPAAARSSGWDHDRSGGLRCTTS
ncbi:sigma-70 family RNA polymerase sigma factor [Saccharothrix syringae]|uniref:sigma-70 family RNA polymerase sigma factor n=1 Tax=Saccharothrix syringae TaxID=103733 RepID=UPI00069219BF|nr:sigma-70 family RNA polymerase sigma factor [Saccharothrix syringae]